MKEASAAIGRLCEVLLCFCLGAIIGLNWLQSQIPLTIPLIENDVNKVMPIAGVVALVGLGGKMIARLSNPCIQS